MGYGTVQQGDIFMTKWTSQSRSTEEHLPGGSTAAS